MIEYDSIKNGREYRQYLLSCLSLSLFLCSEHGLQQQLNQALDQLTQLKQSHDDTQAQLIGHSQKYGMFIFLTSYPYIDRAYVYR